jgi:predicted MFS family arabinose efflux permease
LAGIPILFLNWKLVPNVTVHLEKGVETPRQIWREMTSDRNQLVAHVFIVLLMLGQFTVITFIAPYMVSNVGFSEGEIAYVYLAGGICTLFSAPLFGKFSDRYGRQRFFTVVTLCSLLPIWLITNLPRMNMYGVLIITSLMFILISGRVIPAMTMITASVKPERRGGFMSINSAIQQLGAGVSSYVAGTIVVRSASGELQDYNLVGYLAIVASIVAILVAKRLKAVS